MPKRAASTEAMAIFRAHRGTLRTSEALRLGIHPRTLYDLRDKGILTSVSRGVYRLAELPELTEPDLATVALRVPRAVVCLVSALSFHELTTEIPHEVHVALPRGVKTPRLDHPPVRAFHFSGPSLTHGIERHQIDGVTVPIYGPEKSVADSFKFRNKIGTDVAIEALKLCLERPGTQAKDLLHHARLCRVQGVMLPYLEALL